MRIASRRSPIPLFFILVTDGLDRLIRKVSDAGLMKGLLGGRNFVLTNLQYADDTVIFYENKVRVAVVLK